MESFNVVVNDDGTREDRKDKVVELSPAWPIEVVVASSIENVLDKHVAKAHEVEIVNLVDDSNEDVELPQPSSRLATHAVISQPLPPDLIFSNAGGLLSHLFSPSPSPLQPATCWLLTTGFRVVAAYLPVPNGNGNFSTPLK
ncbi:hypothetical protein PVK06_003319 [Gossypium arboreum]|uniref:Uncharacterized protein n=1 Tax=Gossypium arboreum TaxID=29729 RepID=A0ABR0R5Y5_GOSAR|nr:hypothetical protein PVK06_003319 [Gossypium arboreum]